MKNVKKLFALATALAVALSVTACGAAPRGSISPNRSDPAPSAAPEASTEPTPEPEVEIGLGSVKDGAYENSFIGIGCKLGEGWTYLSEEEIFRANNWVVEDGKIAELLSRCDSFFDMVAMDDERLTSVNVLVENLGLLYGTVLDESGYIDFALESIEADLADTDLNIKTCEKISLDFCGRSTYGLYVYSTVPIQGGEGEVFQRLACVKAGGYMCCVTATTYYEDRTSEVLDLFYSI